MVKNSFYLYLIIFLSSCSNKTFDSTDKINNYINDEENEYKYSKTINDINYELVYRPTDLLVQQELGDKKSLKQVTSLREKYGKYMYFTLSMSINGKELLNSVARDKVKFGQMVNELAFGIEEKVNLYTPGKDTLTIADFIYPRMYGMSNSTSLMLVFPRDKIALKNKYLNFTIQDFGFNTGDVKFKISTNAIINEPKLQF